MIFQHAILDLFQFGHLLLVVTLEIVQGFSELLGKVIDFGVIVLLVFSMQFLQSFDVYLLEIKLGIAHLLD